MSVKSYDVNVVIKAIDRASSALRKISSQMNSLRSQAQVISKEMLSSLRGLKAVGEITSPITLSTNVMRRLRSEVNSFAVEIGKAATKTRTWDQQVRVLGVTLRTLKAGIMSVVGGLIAFEAFTRTIQFFSDSITIFAEVEKRMTALATVSREAGQSIRALSEEYIEAALRASREFGVSIDEAAAALDSLVRAGLSGRDAIQALNAVLAISISEGTSAAQVADILAATLAQFGLSAEEASRAADALVNAAAVGVSTMTEYANGLSYVGAVAHQLGFSLEETLAALVKVDASIKDATKSGRYLQAMLSALAEKSDKLGFSIYDATGKLLPLPEIIRRLTDHLRGMATEQERNAYLFKIFGEQGARAVASLIDLDMTGEQVAQSLMQLEQSIGKSGTAMEVVGEVLDTTAGKMAQAEQRIQELQYRIGEGLAPVIISAADLVIGFADALDLLAKAATGATVSLEDLSNVTGTLANGLKILFPLQGLFFDLINQQISQIEEYKQKVEATREGLDYFETGIRNITNKLTTFENGLRGVGETLLRFNENIIETTETTLMWSENTSASFDKLNRYMKELGSRYISYSDYIKKVAEMHEAHEEALRKSVEVMEDAIPAVEQFKQAMEGLQLVQQNISFYAQQINVAEQVRKALYIESSQALSSLNELLKGKNELTQEELALGQQSIQTLLQQNVINQEQASQLEALLNKRMQGIELSEEELALLEAVNTALEKKTSLTAQEAATLERLQAIGSVLNMTYQAMQLQMTAMQLAAMGNVEAAENIANALQKVKEALEDGYISAEEFQEILETLGYTPFEISFDLTPLEEGFVNLSTAIQQNMTNIFTDVQNQVQTQFIPALTTAFTEGSSQVAAALQEVMAPALTLVHNQVTMLTTTFQTFKNTGLDPAKDSIEQLTTKVLELAQAFNPELASSVKEVQSKVDSLDSRMPGFISSFRNLRDMVDQATASINSLKEAIEKLPTEKTVTIRVRRVEETEAGAGETARPAQTGEWFVPRNNMLYRLHRGEMVLPRPVAEWFRRGLGIQSRSIVVNVSVNASVSRESDWDEVARIISRKIISNLRVM